MSSFSLGLYLQCTGQQKKNEKKLHASNTANKTRDQIKWERERSDNPSKLNWM